MKKVGFFAMLAALIFCLSFAGQARAQTSGATIVLDGQALSLQKKDKVEIIKGSVMVPLRVIAENLALLVTWNQQHAQVKILTGTGDIELTIGRMTASVGGAELKLNAAPVNRSGTTLVPLRFIGEAAGLEVGWDNTKKVVNLASSEASQPTPTPAASPTPIPSSPASPTPTPALSPTPSPGTTPMPAASPSPVSGGQIKGIGWSDDRLAISFVGSLVPKTYAASDPARIVVELPKTSFDPAFASIQNFDAAGQSGAFAVTDSSNATRVKYAVTDISAQTITITLELSGSGNKTFTTYQEADFETSVYVIDLKTSAVPTPTPIIPNNGKKIVVIDPGHGDGDPGGVGATNKLEKNFNLSLALKVESLLLNEPAFQVIMTRRDDTFVPRPERASLANAANADAFVSIHANIAEGKPTVRGTETYYYKNSGKGLADIMHKHVLSATGFTDRKVKNANYQVLRETTMPATLLEVGFLSNATEESILFGDSFQNRVAQAIVDGLKEYFGVK